MVFWACSVKFSMVSARVRYERWLFDFMFGLLKYSHYLYTRSTDHTWRVPPPTEMRTTTYVRRAASHE